MDTFVRTTGGLLQLKTKQVSEQDYESIVQFAQKLGDGQVRSRLAQHGQPTQSQPLKVQVDASVAPRQQPVDLQAVTPEVFR